MTLPARRDPAAEALQLAAIRMQEGPYRGHELAYGADKLWRVNGQPWALPTAAPALPDARAGAVEPVEPVAKGGAS